VADPESAALHHAEAAAPPDESIAARLEDAAAIASSRGASIAALELYERAVDLSDPDAVEALARRRPRLAEARFVVGETRVAHAELTDL